jgi:hypothetical protein
MEKGSEPVEEAGLAEIADVLLEESREDLNHLAGALDRLPAGIRKDLFASDLLNAFQVFYYFFRTEPGELETDRLLLQPASALTGGIVLREIDFLEMSFGLEAGEPVITITDEGQLLSRYRGRDAYRQAMEYIDENL